MDFGQILKTAAMGPETDQDGPPSNFPPGFVDRRSVRFAVFFLLCVSPLLFHFLLPYAAGCFLGCLLPGEDRLSGFLVLLLQLHK